jgi:hypothetical protein
MTATGRFETSDLIWKLGAFQAKAAIGEAKKKPPEGGFLDQTWQVIK